MSRRPPEGWIAVDVRIPRDLTAQRMGFWRCRRKVPFRHVANYESEIVYYKRRS